MNRAFRAIRRSDVVALVIEAMACITEQVRDRCFLLCAILIDAFILCIMVHNLICYIKSRLFFLLLLITGGGTAYRPWM